MAAVNAKEYGSIFRILYNVSFLGKDPSEKILSLLTQSEFKNGLRGGVPENIVIAHKFGERELKVGNNVAPVKQLHDCGIIYYPGNPYILCIMTRGPSLQKLAPVIQRISSEVYQEFDARKF